MTKYELSLTKDYVPGWTLFDAVREFFQNALDQETVIPDNEMFWEYDPSAQTLSIGNKASVLEPKTLLLGSTTKADDESTIGQFGEGYKVATLVLLRLGKTVKFYNYGAKEVWTPRFSKSRKYNAEILVFDVDKKFLWTHVPDNNLTIEIGNISEGEANYIEETNLHMQDETHCFETDVGRVLLSKHLRNKVFVNGLHICDYEKYNYGYDFKPSQISLDRDRKLISDFNLEWLASKMWANAEAEDMKDIAVRLIRSGAADTKYLKDTLFISDKRHTVALATHKAFVGEHGENAIPVTSTEELQEIPEGYIPIIVNEQVKELVTSSPEYKEVERIEKPSLQDRLMQALEEWAERYLIGKQEDGALRDLYEIAYLAKEEE